MSDERDGDTAMTGELARANSYAVELETLRARVEELEEQIEELEGTESRYAAALIGHADAESRLRAVSEALEEKPERYSLMSSMEGYTKIETGEFIAFADFNEWVEQLRAIIEGK